METDLEDQATERILKQMKDMRERILKQTERIRKQMRPETDGVDPETELCCNMAVSGFRCVMAREGGRYRSGRRAWALCYLRRAHR